MIGDRSIRKGFLARTANALVLALNVCVALGLVASAYCGTVPPTELPKGAVISMTFPAWFFGAVVLFGADLLLWRRTAFVPAIAMICSIGAINDFCPMHFPKGRLSEEKQERALTVMTYNVYGFQNQDNDYNRDYNEQLQYIIDKEPDIVCIEEALMLAQTPENKISTSQLNRLAEIYPYQYILGNQLAFLSKYEAQPISLDIPKIGLKEHWVGCWRLKIDGKVINFFGVHLRSLLFSMDERANFKEMTTPDRIEDLNRADLRFARTDLIPKIIEASVDREEQMSYILKYIKKYGGENVVLCGDFNDPVGCYPLHMLKKYAHMREVYSEVGLGPMITYNANHFLFRIDHMLYRGCLRPYSMERGNLKASDHYPLTTTFIIE